MDIKHVMIPKIAHEIIDGLSRKDAIEVHAKNIEEVEFSVANILQQGLLSHKDQEDLASAIIGFFMNSPKIEEVYAEDEQLHHHIFKTFEMYGEPSINEEQLVQESIIKAKAELDTKPIVAIDYVLEAFSKAKEMKIANLTSELLTIFAQAILSQIKGTDEDLMVHDPISGLFNQDLSHQDQRFVAICLLRLLCTNNYCFKDSWLHINTFNLFDKVLSEDIYKALKINQKDQTFEKQAKLKDMVPQVESDLRTVIYSLSNLDVLGNIRQRFMQVINGTLSKAILWPFLPRELLATRLDEIFTSVQEYFETKGPEMLKGFQKAREILNTYLSQAEQYGTYYSRQYLGGISGKLGNILKKHFEESEESKPAAVSVKKLEKKFPLHAIGADINIGFIVQNAGPGHAFDIYLKFTATDNLRIKRPEIYLGYLEPTSIRVEVPLTINSAEEIAIASVDVSWTNFDRSNANKSFEFELQSQRTDIDWEGLAKEEPYSLEAVETESELVGRREVLEQLIAQAQAKSIGSSYIFGQKRVGKTSIVKTLHTYLRDLKLSNYLVVYLEGGDYVDPDPITTIERLGRRICQEIKEADPRFNNLEIPDFIGALSPLAEFLRSVVRVAPDYHILFILDEFDELPIELYKRGSIGDAFFLTLRSISGKRPFGFILVGSEKMDFIMSCQGDALNKFQAIRIDYFDRDEHWPDFQELIRRPVEQRLEISDDALIAIYEQTAGNPYFAKLICKPLFKMMVARRDCHVTRTEIEECTKRTLQTVASNSFQHFWEDGIFQEGDRAEEVSMSRRKLLLYLADVYRGQGIARKENIIKQEIGTIGASTLESELREFERRQVLIAKNDFYDCKVPFFREWLKERGVREIITTFSDLDAILIRKKQEEEAYIRSEEIVGLVGRWGVYKGRTITEDQVRAWLSQFGDNSNQRLMFRILHNLTFYTADNIRSKMRESHGIVGRGLIWRIEKQRKRPDIIVSYLDSPGKSGGGYYAKLYADENEIYYGNVIERGKLADELVKRKDLQALVFVDDFIGTGDSASEYFRHLTEECGEVLRNSGLRVFFVAICGFQASQAKIENVLTECSLPISVHICDPLDKSAKCFGDSSKIFPDAVERERARNIAYQHGIQLVKKAPLAKVYYEGRSKIANDQK